MPSLLMMPVIVKIRLHSVTWALWLGSRRCGCPSKQPRVEIRVSWVRASNRQEGSVCEGSESPSASTKTSWRGLEDGSARCDVFPRHYNCLAPNNLDLKKPRKRSWRSKGDSGARKGFYRSVAAQGHFAIVALRGTAPHNGDWMLVGCRLFALHCEVGHRGRDSSGHGCELSFLSEQWGLAQNNACNFI